jgi:TPR repeat protein
VRRYVEGERRDHPWHYDNDAFVTVVVPLTAASDYQGGIYVQPSFDRQDRQFVDLEAGDAVVHNFDVLHGVEVLSGERLSLIIWIKSDANACATKACPWYAEKAERGDPNAQYNHGRLIANGLGEFPADRVAGVKWYVKAASQGHVMAMYNLAVCHHQGRGVTINETEAVAWYKQAALAGHPLAMTNYGYMMKFGKGVQQKNSSEAAVWFLKAALQQVPTAMFQLAHLHGAGDGVDRNLTVAEHWLELATASGHQDAKNALRSLRSRGTF